MPKMYESIKDRLNVCKEVDLDVRSIYVHIHKPSISKSKS